MSFVIALPLVKSLEGPGKAGEKWGMTQGTWELLGFKGRVEDASDPDIANAYRMLWDSLKFYDVTRQPASVCAFSILPEPADSVAFQFFINVPFTAFIKALQGALGAKMDGVLGRESWRAVEGWNGQGMALSEKVLTAQEWHYRSGHSPDKDGLLNRVERVREWLREQ